MRPNHRNRRIWLFNAADYAGNPKWLFEYVNRHRPDIEAYWITDSPATLRRVRRRGFRAIAFLGERSRRIQRSAGIFVVNQVKERIPADLTGVVLLNLWHGVGVKKVERAMTGGYLMPRIAGKYIRNNRAYRESQLFLVTSPAMEAHFARQIDFDESQVIRAGYPQNAYRRLHGPVATFDHDLRGSRGLPPETRIVLYAPTFRLSGNDEFVRRAIPDMDRVIARLEEHGLMLVLKMHPHLATDRDFLDLKARYGDHPRLVFWDNAEDVYEVFDQVDTAIVDYSSIHYDLMAAGVTRFVRYAFDLGEPGTLEPGLDYLSSSCGTLVTSFDELVPALGRDHAVDPAELARLTDLFWAYDDDDTFGRIVAHALAYEVRDVELPTLHSFDVFDTVIHRRAVAPRSIAFAVQQRAESSEIGLPAYLVRRFVEVRAHAESALREARRKDPRNAETMRFEISLDEIYARIGELFDLADEQVASLMAWEVEFELANVMPNAAMVERVRGLVEAGETVVLISDMYLPSEVVRRMLAQADPVLAEVPLYVSSDHGVQKSTGWLFVQVYLDLGYDFAEWRHTGDNAHADIEMASRLGISATACETPRFDAYEKALTTAVPTHDGYLLAGMMRAARAAGLTGAELFAYRTVSLSLVPYVMWAVQDAVERGYETLYFISRDGHHLKRIADAVIRHRGLDLRTAYIHGSRRAWRLASQLDGVDDDTFAPHGSFGGVRTFGGLVAAARLDERELLELFPEFQRYRRMPRFDAHTAATIVEALRSSAEYRRRLERIAAEDRELTTRYLLQEIDTSERFAFVEYWGRGYTQDCLVRLLEHATGRETDAPFYYARSIYPSEGAAVRHNYTSAAYSLLLIESVFANLPYGTTEGYTEVDGRVRHVAAERDHHSELREAIERMLPRFVDDLLELPAIDLERLARDAFRFGFEHFRTSAASPEYVEFLAPLRDAVELGSVEREFAPRLTVADFVAFLRGRPVGEITRSMPMSMARSTGLAPALFRLQKEVGFRRVVKARARAVRALAMRVRPVTGELELGPFVNPPVHQQDAGSEPTAEERTAVPV
ncbi:CDP-glycerol glycerophosphotransferase family protein [Agromyces tropicus]|uniref:CDP-glycerol glycerophosphotransferase family protein n=1 Tax=Agromyces tropicus TaxID=555371 RepID=UPI0031CE6C76